MININILSIFYSLYCIVSENYTLFLISIFVFIFLSIFLLFAITLPTWHITFQNLLFNAPRCNPIMSDSLFILKPVIVHNFFMCFDILFILHLDLILSLFLPLFIFIHWLTFFILIIKRGSLILHGLMIT